MPVSDGFLAFVTEQLEQVTNLSSRKMFGAVGFYDDGVFFAIVDDDELYLKVNDSTRPNFEERAMEPFRPYGDERSMNYYQAPADVLEDVAQLAVWVRDAVEVGRSSKRSKRKSGKEVTDCHVA